MGALLARWMLPLLAISFLAGCGSATGLTSIDGYLKKPVEFPKVRPDGRLTSAPPPVTAAIVSEQPTDSPQQLIDDLWYLGQAGQLGVVSLYESVMQQSIGIGNLVGALDTARNYMRATRPRIAAVVPRGQLTTVDVLLFSKGAPPAPATFTLSKRTGKWLIAYDSFTAQFLSTYVETVKDSGLAKPTKAGTAAGAAAATSYRSAFVRAFICATPACLRSARALTGTARPSGATPTVAGKAHP